MTTIPGSDFAPSSRVSESMPVSHFLTGGQLETTEQIRRFELLRLAFFALKLRKLEQRLSPVDGEESAAEPSSEWEFRRNLLRHAIFQQVLTLMKLDAREQAMQIIAACRQ